MMLWFILTLMTSAAAVWVATPFLRSVPPSDETNAADTSVYRDQLAEVDREARDGLIAPEQAEAARIEIKRRVLALDKTSLPAMRRLSDIERTFLGRGLAGAAVIGAMVLYMMQGSPEIPAAPRKATTLAGTLSGTVPGASGAVPAAAPAAQAAAQGAAPAAGGPSVGGVDEMIERLAARLAANPADAAGWRMLGWSYFGTERFVEAAAAYGKAVALSPTVGNFRTSQGEALVRAADGKVTPEALKLFDSAAKLDAKDGRARYFIGVSKEQGGDKKAALADWLAALAAAGPADDWATELEPRVVTLAKELGQDITGKIKPRAASAPVAAPAVAAVASAPPAGGILGKLNADATKDGAPAARGPTAADVKAAEALPASDRAAMINGMVDSLQKRLDASPRDAEGWLKLIRSRMVLGEPDKAKQALDRALKTFADSPADAKQIADAAAELGLKR
jgi:cytochrome c-type biogenesis protein CcmH